MEKNINNIYFSIFLYILLMYSQKNFNIKKKKYVTKMGNFK